MRNRTPRPHHIGFLTVECRATGVGVVALLLMASLLMAPRLAAGEPNAQHIELLQAGRAPRQRLVVRYPKTGPSRVNLRTTLSEQGGTDRFTALTAVEVGTQNQDTRWPVRAQLVGLEADSYSPQKRELLSGLLGIAVQAQADATGAWNKSQLHLRGQPVQLEREAPFPELRRLLDLSSPPPFPREPVGVGAKWRVGETVVTLAAVAADAVDLEFSGEATTDPRSEPTPVSGHYRVSLVAPVLEGSLTSKVPTYRGVTTVVQLTERVSAEFVESRFVTWSSSGEPDGLECPRRTAARIVPFKARLFVGVDIEGLGWRCETRDGRAHGPTVVWDHEGNRTLTGAYRHDRRDGVWRTFADGLPLLELEYEDGTLVMVRRLQHRSGYSLEPKPTEVYLGEADLEPRHVPSGAQIFADVLPVSLHESLFGRLDHRLPRLVFAADALRARPRYGPMLPLPQPDARTTVDEDAGGEAETISPPPPIASSQIGRDTPELETVRLHHQSSGAPSVELRIDKKGKAHDPVTFHYPSGRVLARGAYRHGLRHGVWIANYDNDAGSRAIEAEFRGGLGVGQWRLYRPDGSLTRDRSYTIPSAAELGDARKVFTSVEKDGERPAPRNGWPLAGDVTLSGFEEAFVELGMRRDEAVVRERQYSDAGLLFAEEREIPRGRRMQTYYYANGKLAELRIDPSGHYQRFSASGETVSLETSVFDTAERRVTYFKGGTPSVTAVVSERSGGLSGPLVSYGEDGGEELRLSVELGVPDGPYRLPFRDGEIKTGSFAFGGDSQPGLCPAGTRLVDIDNDINGYTGHFGITCKGDDKRIELGWALTEQGFFFAAYYSDGDRWEHPALRQR